MYSSWTLIFVAVGLWLHAVHCKKSKHDLAERNQTSKDDELIHSINNFALDLYKEVSKTNEGNFIFSPFGADISFTIMLMAAKGNTANEINRTLHYEQQSLKNLKRKFRAIQRLLKSRKIYKNILNISNSLWIEKQAVLPKKFSESVTNDFDATAKKIDFQEGEKAKDIINSWSNNATKGLIPTLFDNALRPDTAAVLVNAIYFKGIWKNKFDKSQTKNKMFYNTRKKPFKKVPMMNQAGPFNCRQIETETVKMSMLEMEYQLQNISMIILLPDEDTYFHDVELNLTYCDIGIVLAGNTVTEVSVTIPKFQDESELNLIPLLKKLGVRDALSKTNASFPSFGKEKVSVSEAFQKSMIVVNEEGSEAAAAVSGVMTYQHYLSPGPFLANRPFIYFIVDKLTGIILLMGRVKEPE